MGKYLFDNMSKGHFYGGVISGIIFFPNNYILSFIISLGIHLLIEMVEKNKTLCGNQIETKTNHIGDLLSFFGGWLLSIKYKLYKLLNTFSLIILWCIFIYFSTREFLREIMPFNKKNILFTGVYQKNNKKCFLKSTIV
jgi:hypothetical protein